MFEDEGNPRNCLVLGGFEEEGFRFLESGFYLSNSEMEMCGDCEE